MTDWDRVRYFRRHEFGLGEPGVEPDPDLVRLLDEARNIAGIPFAITSGLRTRTRNTDDEVGGAEQSAHVTGHAADIRAPTGRHRFLIVRAALDVGFNRIGVYSGHVHLDNSPDLPQDVIWTGQSR